VQQRHQLRDGIFGGDNDLVEVVSATKPMSNQEDNTAHPNAFPASGYRLLGSPKSAAKSPLQWPRVRPPE